MSTLLHNTTWIVFATGFLKILAIFAQIVLGFYLEKESFGVYAFALGITGIFLWLKNGAITQQIVKASMKSGYKQNDYINYAQLFNYFSAIALLFLSFFYWGSSLSFIIVTFAISQFFSTPALLSRVECTVQKNYKKLAFIEIGQGFVRNFVLIGTAIYLKDETAFAYSILAVILYDVLINKIVFQYPLHIHMKSIKLYRMKRIFIHGKWQFVGALASIFVMQGSFAVIGSISNETFLGIYFFAFQLIAMISILVGEAIRKVLMPSFVTIKSFQDRNLKFHKIIQIGLVFLVPISFHMMLSIDPILKLIWGSKWIDAIEPGMTMAIVIFLPILVTVAYSLLEAHNEWKFRNIMQLGDALLLVLTATLGALSHSLWMLAIIVAIGKVLSAMIQLILVYKKYALSIKDFFKTLAIVLIVNVILSTVIINISKYLSVSSFEYLLMIIFSFIIYASLIVSNYKNRLWGKNR